MSSRRNSDDHWSYENPSEWCKQFSCANGLCQSPIDINTSDTTPEVYQPFVFSSKYNSSELFTLTNHGRQITSELSQPHPNEYWFTGGGLSGMFYFVNFHLHWGRNNRHGSEHQINGYRYPAEAHFVHKNPDNGQVAVLAIFLTISDHAPGEWEKYTDAASRLVKIHDTNNCKFNLSQLMQVANREFFRYTGSLTTPPCTEGVIWTIFSHEIPIQEESLELLRQTIMGKVYRPIQPLNGRTIFRNYEYSKMI